MDESKTIEWVFSGIGTQIISYLITAGLSAFIGYKIGVKNTVKQIQKAGENSKQHQVSTVKNLSSIEHKVTTLTQIQESGNNSSQKQIGDTHNDG